MWWVILFVVTSIVMPLLGVLIIARLPPNYFVDHNSREWWVDRHPLVRILARIAKNILGVALLIAGAIMLVTPGQGLVTLFFGILLIDFPGKQNFQLRVIRHPRILRSVNRLRGRFGQPPFVTG